MTMTKKHLFILSLIGVATYLWTMEEGKEGTTEQFEKAISALPEKAQWTIMQHRPLDPELKRYLFEFFLTQKLLTHSSIPNPMPETQNLMGHFSHDGTKIITMDIADNRVVVWDARTAQQLQVLTHDALVEEIAFSTDDTKILSHTETESVAWDTATGRIIRSFARFCFFSPDGTKAIVLEPNEATIWDTVSGAQGRRVTIPEHTDDGMRQHFFKAEFSYDNTRVLTVPRLLPDNPNIDIVDDGNYTTIIWDVRTGDELFTIETTQRISSASFSPDGNYIVATPLEGPLIVDAHTGITNFELYSNQIRALFSADSKKIFIWPGIELTPEEIAEEEYSPDFIDDASMARLWDINAQRLLQSFRTGLYIRHGIASLSTDGNVVATLLDNGQPMIWNAQTGKLILSLPIKANFVTVNRDGSQVLTNPSDGQSLILWNLNIKSIEKILDYLTLEQHRLLQAFGRTIRDTNSLRKLRNNPNLAPQQILATREQMKTFLGLDPQIQRALRPFITDNFLQQLQRIPDPARSVLRKRHFDRILGKEDGNGTAKKQKQE